MAKCSIIVGPSGSGKTTLLSMISGILRPDAGTVVVKDQEIWNLSPNDIADFRLHHIGFVFQDYHLFPQTDHGGKRRHSPYYPEA